MSQPKVTINELDGALGILPATEGRLYAVAGVSSSGPVDTPAAYARVTSLVNDFGSGPAVEAAAHYIEKYGRPVVFCRAAASTPGDFPADDAVTQVGTGTSVATVDNVGSAPNDDLEFYLVVVNGGTIGTDGITFRWSVDGGRTLSPETSLGTASSFTFPGTGADLDFAAGTLVAGDTISFLGAAPKWSTTEIQSALNALFASGSSWEICHVVGDLLSTDVAVIDPIFSSNGANGKPRSWVGHVRMDAVGESAAAYAAALNTAMSSVETRHGMICAGAAKTASSVTGRQYRRPSSFVIAAREQSVAEHINTADVKLGGLPGVSLRDALGNPSEHDESLNPGLDDLRFAVLRTWEGIAGVYVNRPILFSPEGSDFELHAHRRVMNLAHIALRPFFIRRLNSPILVNRTTGFILEEEAKEIESGARSALRAVLLGTPKASAVEVTVSRTDDILSTKTLNAQARIVPLGYPEAIVLDLGFLNPALAVQTA